MLTMVLTGIGLVVCAWAVLRILGGEREQQVNRLKARILTESAGNSQQYPSQPSQPGFLPG